MKVIAAAVVGVAFGLALGWGIFDRGWFAGSDGLEATQVERRVLERAAGEPRGAACTKRQHPENVWSCSLDYGADCPTIDKRVTTDEDGVVAIDDETSLLSLGGHPLCAREVTDQIGP